MSLDAPSYSDLSVEKVHERLFALATPTAKTYLIEAGLAERLHFAENKFLGTIRFETKRINAYLEDVRYSTYPLADVGALLTGAAGLRVAQFWLGDRLAKRDLLRTDNPEIQASGMKKDLHDILTHPLSTYMGVLALKKPGATNTASNETIATLVNSFRRVLEYHPNEHDAFLRDLQRLHRGVYGSNSEQLPYAEGTELENPFQFSMGGTLESAKKLALQSAQYSQWEVSDGQKLYGRVRAATNNAQRSQDAFSIWNQCNTRFEGTTYLRVPQLTTLSQFLTDQHLRQVLRQFFKAYIKENPQGYGIACLANLLQNKRASKFFCNLLSKDEAVQKFVFNAVKFGSPTDSVFAIQIVDATLRYLMRVNNPGMTLFLAKFINHLISTKEDLESKDTVLKLHFVCSWYLENVDLGIKIVGGLLLMNPAMMAELLEKDLFPPKDFNEHPEWIQRVQAAIPLLGRFEKNELLVIFRTIYAEKGWERDMLKLDRMVRPIKLPKDFSSESALREIRTAKSWAPVEARVLRVPNDVLPATMRAHLLPHPAERTVDSWSVCLESLTVVHGEVAPLLQMIPGKIDLNFKTGRLEEGKFPPKQRHLLEQLGIYLAHQYFVRHRVETEGDVIREIVGRTLSGHDRNDSDSAAVREAGPRAEAPLTLDLRDQDEAAVKEHQQGIERILGANRAVLDRLMKGQAQEDDFKEALLFEKKALNGGGQAHVRADPDYVRLAYECGEMDKADFQVLITAPHMSSLGYAQFDHRVRNGAGEDGAGEDGGIIKGVVRRKPSQKADLKYLYYLQAGLPELSEMQSFQNTLGLMVDDPDYRPDEVVMIHTGEETDLIFIQTQWGLNSQLALKMRDRAWIESFLAEQKRVLMEEMSVIRRDVLDTHEQTALLTEREDRIAHLKELGEKMRRESYISVNRGQKNQASVRLTMGWMQTSTTFNQGQYRPLVDLYSKPS